MKNLYLVLTIVGTVVPYLFFFDFFAEHGIHLPAFIGGLFANGAAGGFSADLLITSAAFWVFLREVREPRWWMYVALNLLIGMSCAVPLYLYLTADQRSSTRAALA